MSEDVLVVGVDVSKDNLDVAFVLGKGDTPQDLGKFSNKSKGFSSLAKKLQKAFKKTGYDSFEVVVEPTGATKNFLSSFVSARDGKQRLWCLTGSGNGPNLKAQEARPMLWMPAYWLCTEPTTLFPNGPFCQKR